MRTPAAEAAAKLADFIRAHGQDGVLCGAQVGAFYRDHPTLKPVVGKLKDFVLRDEVAAVLGWRVSGPTQGEVFLRAPAPPEPRRASSS